LTSTTPVDILTVTLDPQNDTYKLDVRGNFVYRVGVRWWVKGNRKTTASANITSNLPNNIDGHSNLSASDDGDNEVILRIGTGDLANSFTVRGNVGADGDIIIITGVYCQITIRRYIKDAYGYLAWAVFVRERGLMQVVGRQVSITTRSTNCEVMYITGTQRMAVWTSANGTDIIFASPVLAVWDMPEVVIAPAYGEDSIGETLFLFLSIVVLGE
jgi:hypothetical protein